MKTTTTVQVPAGERTVEKTTCSLCGKPCGDDEELDGAYQVKEAEIVLSPTHRAKLVAGEGVVLSLHHAHRIKISGKEGDSYGGDGGHVEHKIIDCCYDCFNSAAIPALEAAGFSVRTEIRDY